MQCPECGTTIEDGSEACPGCAAAHPVSEPPIRRVRVGFAIALTALFLVAFVAVLLRPAGRPTAPPASNVSTRSVEPTLPVDPVRAAIAQTIRGFYATVDAGESVTVSPYVYPQGSGGTAPAQVESTTTTDFSIARAVVGSGTADVYGRESRPVIAPRQGEVEFRLRLVDDTWLISSWQVAREATTAPQALALSNVTARDIVGTLLQARQAGDATTVRLLTTERFRSAHSSWLNGADQTALLLSYRVVSAQARGAEYTVTVAEDWKPTPLTTTYTVVLSNGEILVDAWSWK